MCSIEHPNSPLLNPSSRCRWTTLSGGVGLSLALFFAIPLGSAGADRGIEVLTDVPFGNAANIRITNEASVTTVRFTPHPHGGPESLWFCFRVKLTGSPAESSVEQGKLQVVLECPGNTLGGGQLANFRPVYRIGKGEWQRAAAPEIIGLPDGRREAAWRFPMPAVSMDMALCYPYGREDLEKLLQETKGFWRLDTIGVSHGGRSLLRLSNGYGGSGANDKWPGYYLLARQHSGEVSGSWVLDGVLRRLAELGKDAPLVWAVLLANIDGVEQGDYGKDNFPYDLNRAWGEPPMRHEVLVFQRDMRLFAGRCAFLGGVDFHSPGGTEASGIYVYVSGSDRVPEASSASTNLATALSSALGPDLAAEKFVRVGDYRSRWETPRFSNFCQDELGAPGLALETPYALIRGRVLSREDFQQAGRKIADALAEYAAKSLVTPESSQPEAK